MVYLFLILERSLYHSIWHLEGTSGDLLVHLFYLTCYIAASKYPWLSKQTNKQEIQI